MDGRRNRRNSPLSNFSSVVWTASSSLSVDPRRYIDSENNIVSRSTVIITLRSKKRENSCISSSHFRGLTTGVSSDTSVSEKDGN